MSESKYQVKIIENDEKKGKHSRWINYPEAPGIFPHYLSIVYGCRYKLYHEHLSLFSFK